MTDPFFFGYGSLVNVDTHDFGQVHLAQARGWKRAWRHTSLRKVSFLTAVPDTDCTIDGVIAAVPGADWTALDAREHAYDRIPANNHIEHKAGTPLDIAIYAIAPDRHGPPSNDHPILMSYLETVLQGYLHQFGARGVAGFLNTTDGWEAPILDDRARPDYPRHCQVAPEESTLFADLLSGIGARIMTPARQSVSP